MIEGVLKEEDNLVNFALLSKIKLAEGFVLNFNHLYYLPTEDSIDEN